MELKLFITNDHEEGQRLSLHYTGRIKNVLDKDNKREPTPRDDVYLLKEISMPSVLVEGDFYLTHMKKITNH